MITTVVVQAIIEFSRIKFMNMEDSCIRIKQIILCDRHIMYLMEKKKLNTDLWFR